ncbi:hypothetical protein PSCICM_27460 [Pseudomonas cichorii]|uniref:Uncharacterized protein n=1 Tax=Pseudomonas cichorii TaxID=36746 RepID=A0ABQ1DSV6_PSECI|nr:hypothetical protein PSCICM_27460 [Pseudomonas cichorii]GFM93993.1 hypothetical protein PSCICP_39650 [Pseudomonas cichorii]
MTRRNGTKAGGGFGTAGDMPLDHAADALHTPRHQAQLDIEFGTGDPPFGQSVPGTQNDHGSWREW